MNDLPCTLVELANKPITIYRLLSFECKPEFNSNLPKMPIRMSMLIVVILAFWL